jgi:hypothetical protein
MDDPNAHLDPITVPHNELLALIEPTTGPLTDLRLRLVDERGGRRGTARTAIGSHH